MLVQYTLMPTISSRYLELVSSRLRDAHRQSTDHMHQLTLTASHVLDAMADSKVKDLDREKLHEPLSTYLGGLKESKQHMSIKLCCVSRITNQHGKQRNGVLGR
jgi:hypothetical protein